MNECFMAMKEPEFLMVNTRFQSRDCFKGYFFQAIERYDKHFSCHSHQNKEHY